MKYKTTLTIVGAALLLWGCSENKSEPKAVAEASEVPAVFVSEALNGTATPILQAAEMKPGTEVLLTGLIMGAVNPFVEGRAAFILGDEATITPCDAKDDDHCSRPWDTCCDPIAARIAGTVTIQVLDANGHVLKQGLKGVNGLKELSRVTVNGTVADNSTKEAFVVNANAIHIGVR